jgi:anaphase-promoting complex subunit 2
MLETPVTAGRNRVLGSVFSPASPSPQRCSPASLALGLKSLNPSSRSADSFVAAHRSYNRPSDATECLIDDAPSDQATWDRAWHIATAFLAVPDRGFGQLLASGDTDETEFLRQWNRHAPPSKEASDALAYLLRPLSRGEGLRAEKGQGNILVWYEFEMRRHFLKNFRDGLLKVCFVYLLSSSGWR